MTKKYWAYVERIQLNYNHDVISQEERYLKEIEKLKSDLEYAQKNYEIKLSIEIKKISEKYEVDIRGLHAQITVYLAKITSKESHIRKLLITIEELKDRLLKEKGDGKQWNIRITQIKEEHTLIVQRLEMTIKQLRIEI